MINNIKYYIIIISHHERYLPSSSLLLPLPSIIITILWLGNDGNIRMFTLHGDKNVKVFPRAHTCFNRIDMPIYKVGGYWMYIIRRCLAGVMMEICLFLWCIVLMSWDGWLERSLILHLTTLNMFVVYVIVYNIYHFIQWWWYDRWW